MLRWQAPRAVVTVTVATAFILAALCITSHRQQQQSRDIIVQAQLASNGVGSLASIISRSSSPGAVASTAVSLVPAVPTAAPEVRRRPPLTAVCLSDTHGLFQEERLIEVPEGDLLLFPGDAAVGSGAEGLSFSRWLEGLPVRGPRVVTWGNMDTATPGLADPVPGATVIVNAIREVSGYRIFASPWTPRFAGAYQLDLGPDESFKYWSQLLPPNADVDIVLTHGPPYGIADQTSGRHRGDVGLLRAVQALQKPPLLWVCGHIHEQYGTHRVPHDRAPGGHIPLINAAVFYVQRRGHEQSAQPRAVRLPEGELLPRGGGS